MNNHKPKLELTWIGKDQQPKLEPRILIEDPEKSYRASGSPERHAEPCHPGHDPGSAFVSASATVSGPHQHTDNMLIYGDNLLALKALEQDFAGILHNTVTMPNHWLFQHKNCVRFLIDLNFD